MSQQLHMSLVVASLVVGVFIGVVVADSYHTHRSPATDTLRDLCVETATRTTFPTLYIEGKGCVILVTPTDKGART